MAIACACRIATTVRAEAISGCAHRISLNCFRTFAGHLAAFPAYLSFRVSPRDIKEWVANNQLVLGVANSYDPDRDPVARIS